MPTFWRSESNGNWIPWESHDQMETGPAAGAYSVISIPLIGAVLQPTFTTADKILPLPEPYSDLLMDEFERFWEAREEFVARGFVHKRGYLLYGQPGAGKTALIKILTDRIIAKNGIVFVENDIPTLVYGIRLIRRNEPTRPIVVVLEDLDDILDDEGEPPVCSLLDGEHQFSSIIFLATTNYISKLPPRIVNRPSRFDTVLEVRMPNEEARRVYFKAKEPSLSHVELERWVDATDGLSIAALKEVILAVKCFGQSLHQVVERLKKSYKEEK